ncbi:hypothetical protein KFK09_012410 [Dendrobium nobile]|uniref:Uncharacterized protein n=1 Tax=Dendrobium nobile TaxID=94219 RepID=A0A8T3BKQ2_DENNO|nr:hypothetical protein KFK09_012410 [Dendrobium nobile]
MFQSLILSYHILLHSYNYLKPFQSIRTTTKSGNPNLEQSAEVSNDLKKRVSNDLT